MMSDYLLLALLWVAYCAVHSALISISVTSRSRTALGDYYRFYRLFFNVVAIGTLMPVIAFTHSARFKSGPLLVWRGYWRVAEYSLVALGVALLVAGARHYSMLQFLGFLQLRRESTHRGMTGSGNFDATGVLGLVRHPWYLAVFILLWARNLNGASLTVNVVLSIYLVVGTLLEERKLVVEFGEEYRHYQERVSMFVPLKWLSAKRAR